MNVFNLWTVVMTTLSVLTLMDHISASAILVILELEHPVEVKKQNQLRAYILVMARIVYPGFQWFIVALNRGYIEEYTGKTTKESSANKV